MVMSYSSLLYVLALTCGIMVNAAMYAPLLCLDLLIGFGFCADNLNPIKSICIKFVGFFWYLLHSTISS